MWLCYRMNWETQLRTQLLKRLAVFCRVTTKLGKADWTQKSSPLSELIALERKGDVAQNQDISNKPLQSLRHRQASVLLLHSSDIHWHDAGPVLTRLTAVCAPEAKPISRKSPTDTKRLSVSLENFPKVVSEWRSLPVQHQTHLWRDF